MSVKLPLDGSWLFKCYANKAIFLSAHLLRFITFFSLDKSNVDVYHQLNMILVGVLFSKILAFINSNYGAACIDQYWLLSTQTIEQSYRPILAFINSIHRAAYIDQHWFLLTRTIEQPV